MIKQEIINAYKNVDVYYVDKYLEVCSRKSQDEYAERHHILPKHKFSMYSDLSENTWNCAILDWEYHCLAHFYFAKAVNTPGSWLALHAMLNLKNYKNRRSFTDEYVISIARQLEDARKNCGLSDAHKRNISNALKGHAVSAKTRAKLAAASTGRCVSKETREKLSKHHKGKTLSAEHRKKIAAAHKGKTLSAEHRKNLSAVRRKSPVWNELYDELKMYWIQSGNLKFTAFSNWLCSNTKHKSKLTGLRTLVEHFEHELHGNV